MRMKRNGGMTILETLVVIMILGIFMSIAIPSIIQSSRAMGQAKRITARYPDARRALERVSNTVRQTYPAALMAGESFVGGNGSYDAGGINIPSDELSFPVLDTRYAHLCSVQTISYRLELRREEEHVPRGLVRIRSFPGASAEAGITETILENAVGLDFRYLDDFADPPRWVGEWPPESSNETAQAQPSPQGEAIPAGPAQEVGARGETPRSSRLPGAVKVTIFLPKELSRRPTSFTTVVNVPSR